MATYATPDDLRARFEGELPESLDDKLVVKLDDAERLLSRYLPARDIAAYITAGRATAADVRQVLCNMVLRVFRNPTGANSQTAGPFSMSMDRQVAAGRLLLTRDDRRLLGLQAGAQSAEMIDDALLCLARSPHRPWPLGEPVIRDNGPEPEDTW